MARDIHAVIRKSITDIYVPSFIKVGQTVWICINNMARDTQTDWQLIFIDTDRQEVISHRTPHAAGCPALVPMVRHPPRTVLLETEAAFHKYRRTQSHGFSTKLRDYGPHRRLKQLLSGKNNFYTYYTRNMKASSLWTWKSSHFFLPGIIFCSMKKRGFNR